MPVTASVLASHASRSHVSAFAMAMATSSANLARRSSAPAASSSLRAAAPIAPHSFPPMTAGAATRA